MPTFEQNFLAELTVALAAEGHLELSECVNQLRVHEFVECSRPFSQFIYVQPKCVLPEGELSRVLVGGVPGLICLLIDVARIAAIETMGRDVLCRATL